MPSPPSEGKKRDSLSSSTQSKREESKTAPTNTKKKKQPEPRTIMTRAQTLRAQAVEKDLLEKQQKAQPKTKKRSASSIAGL
jgi:hypothetical protein